MKATMKTIRLYGDLGKQFGTVHKLAVRSPAEAIRALCAIKKGFRKYLNDSDKFGIGYTVKNGNQELDHAEDTLQPASAEIKIIPVVIGANAEARVILGAALIAVGVVLNAYSYGTAGNIFIGMGVSLAIGGVAQMLSPPPPTTEIPERPENKPSYTFNGPVNTAAQGHPVAIGYGRMIVGSNVISAGINVEQIQQGFRRVKNTVSVSVDIRRSTGEAYGGDHIPANWFSRTLTASNPILGDTIDTYDYYYYEWTLEAI